MRSGWFGNRLTAAFATVFGLSLALAANNLSAAQQRHINQVNPDLDSDDQLAPSQMRQPLPGAVSQPASPGRASTPPVRHARPSTPADISTHILRSSRSFLTHATHPKLA